MAVSPEGNTSFAPHFASTLMELNSASEEDLSDHAPITVDVHLTEPPPLSYGEPALTQLTRSNPRSKLARLPARPITQPRQLLG
jgi:hypothetical protein